MKKHRIWIPLILTTAAVLLLTGCGQSKSPETAAIPAAEVPAETDAPVREEAAEKAKALAVEAAEENAEQPFLTQITEDDPAIAYVLIRMPDPVGLLPLPIEGEYTRKISWIQLDGTVAYNTLHLTPDGFRMEDANCPGHDCINEGEVTLENRETRVLWNMVICLPHQLSAELITRQEAEQLLGK